MKKPLLLIFLYSFSALLTFSQQKTETFKTKTDDFISKTGTIIKIVDYTPSYLRTKYSNCNTKVRKITNGSNSSLYVFQITNEAQNITRVASIEYSDLIEVIKAFEILKSDAMKDYSSPNYLENKFVSKDGFQVGYYVNDNKLVWYLALEKYGSTNNTVFLDDISYFETSLLNARKKIEELINDNK
jgi:hypothetical protein